MKYLCNTCIWKILVSSILLVLFGFATVYGSQVAAVYTSEYLNDGPYVVLLHGLGRTSQSMLGMGAALAKEDYRILSINYPSRSAAIEDLATDYLAVEIDAIVAEDPDAEIYVVTHSLGGILLRYYATTIASSTSHISAAVMLAPPHQGSDIADDVSSTLLGRKALGDAISQLQKQSGSFVQILPTDIGFPVGVIAGEFDKKVYPEDAVLSSTTEQIILPHAHTWIMNEADTIEMTKRFLETNSF